MVKHTKNEEYSVVITDLGTNGEGIGHLDDGYTLFVNGALVGDQVKTRIIKAQKKYGIGRLVCIEKPSADRIVPNCPVAGKCGGCQISAMSYPAQLKYKENKVRELLVRVGEFDPETAGSVLSPIIGFFDKSPYRSAALDLPNFDHGADMTPERYRNKAQYPIGTDPDGEPVAGFYTNHSHRIIPTDDCLIGSDVDSLILEAVIDYMKRHHIPAYDEAEHKGLVRHVVIRCGYHTGEISVTLVINGKTLPEKEELIEALLNLDAGGKWHVTSICLNSNTEDTNVIMGDNIQVIYGREYITDRIGDIFFRISPLSFYQVNPRQTEVLYGTALDYAGLTGSETVWDLYCGIGTISLFLAKKAGRVYGVEVVPQAIENAKENAEINHIDNAEFTVGKAEEVLPAFYADADKRSEAAHPDVIVVDPPRKGCDTACLDTMLLMAPSKIVYVSCDPATLARDLKYLCRDGKYKLHKVQPVDMFPNSVHVETVVLLSGEKVDGHIDIDLEVEKLEGKSGTATYAEIKAYIKEKYGFNVTSLYIGQIKDNAGIKNRKNYNTGSAKGRVPACPPEKEEAIMDAFRHFGLI